MNVQPLHQMKKTKPRTSTSTRPHVERSTSAQAHQPVSSHDDLSILIAKRAYELYSERGYRHGYALDDWLEANERSSVGSRRPEKSLQRLVGSEQMRGFRWHMLHSGDFSAYIY